MQYVNSSSVTVRHRLDIEWIYKMFRQRVHFQEREEDNGRDCNRESV